MLGRRGNRGGNGADASSQRTTSSHSSDDGSYLDDSADFDGSESSDGSYGTYYSSKDSRSNTISRDDDKNATTTTKNNSNSNSNNSKRSTKSASSTGSRSDDDYDSSSSISESNSNSDDDDGTDSDSDGSSNDHDDMSEIIDPQERRSMLTTRKKLWLVGMLAIIATVLFFLLLDAPYRGYITFWTKKDNNNNKRTDDDNKSLGEIVLDTPNRTSSSLAPTSISIAPTIASSPSQQPSSFPTITPVPTINTASSPSSSMSPSDSVSPSISSSPTINVTRQPSISPTSTPTQTSEPSVSSLPTATTIPIRQEFNVIMELIPKTIILPTEEMIQVWEEVTERHLLRHFWNSSLVAPFHDNHDGIIIIDDDPNNDDNNNDNNNIHDHHIQVLPTLQNQTIVVTQQQQQQQQDDDDNDDDGATSASVINLRRRRRVDEQDVTVSALVIDFHLSITYNSTAFSDIDDVMMTTTATSINWTESILSAFETSNLIDVYVNDLIESTPDLQIILLQQQGQGQELIRPFDDVDNVIVYMSPNQPNNNDDDDDDDERNVTLVPTEFPSSVSPSTSVSPTTSSGPTIQPTSSHTPTLLPTVSFEPTMSFVPTTSHIPTIVPTEEKQVPTIMPTISSIPTLSSIPTIEPSTSTKPTSSSSPTSLITTAPTLSRMPTSLHSSSSPSVSINPSSSIVPTTSQSPTSSLVPTVSLTPTSSSVPTRVPTKEPEIAPSNSPSISTVPSTRPTITSIPTNSPSLTTTTIPTTIPTLSRKPSSMPTITSSTMPTILPTITSSMGPTMGPTLSVSPTKQPTTGPSTSISPTTSLMTGTYTYIMDIIPKSNYLDSPEIVFAWEDVTSRHAFAQFVISRFVPVQFLSVSPSIEKQTIINDVENNRQYLELVFDLTITHQRIDDDVLNDYDDDYETFWNNLVLFAWNDDRKILNYILDLFSATIELPDLPFGEVDRVEVHLIGDRYVPTSSPIPTTAPTSIPTMEPTEPTTSQPTSLPNTIFGEYEVLETVPHDETAFTQGLQLVPSTNTNGNNHNNNEKYFESVGRYGQSEIQINDIETGTNEYSIPLDSQYFASGLTYRDDDNSIILLTWNERTGFIYDATTFQRTDEFSYETSTGQALGICYSSVNNRFYVTDGGINLLYWNGQTLQPEGQITMTQRIAMDGSASSSSTTTTVRRVGELEYDYHTDTILGNIWQQDVIVRIDPMTGFVTHSYDLHPLERSNTANVLYGIAQTNVPNEIWVTGKLWSNMYRIRLL